MPLRPCNASLSNAFTYRERLAGGVLFGLILAAVAIAIGLANSPYSRLYDSLLDVRRPLNTLHIATARPLVFWINETLMFGVFCWSALLLKQLRNTFSGVEKSRLALWWLAAVGSVVVPLLLLTLQQGHFDIGHLAAVAVDPVMVWVGGLLLCRFLSAELRFFAVAFVASQSVVVLGLAYLYKFSELQLGLGMVAGLFFVASVLLGRYGALLSLACAGVAWWALLKMGLPGALAGIGLACALPLPRNQTQSTILLSGVVVLLVCPFLVANAGVGLYGVDPGYILQLPALSLLLSPQCQDECRTL